AMPAADQWRGERSFAEAIRRQMGTATSGVVLYRSEGPIFYLGLPHPLPYDDDAARLRRDALEGNVRWVIVRRRDLATFESALRLAASVAAREKAFPFEPHKHTLNKEVLVVLQAPEKPGSVK